MDDDDDAWLEVVEMPGRSEGDMVELREPLTVGRAAGVDLRVKDSTVARRHARFERRDGAWHLEDLASPGGTFVDGKRAPSPHLLEDGELVRLGRVVFRFRRGGKALFADVSRRGDWVLFNRAGPSEDAQLHAIALDASERSGFAWLEGAPYACGTEPGRPRLVDHLEDGGIVVADGGGVSFRRLESALTERGDALEASLVAAACVAASFSSRPGALPFAARFTFRGGVLVCPHPQMGTHSESAWCVSIANVIAVRLGLSWENETVDACKNALARFNLPMSLPYALPLKRLLQLTAAEQGLLVFRKALVDVARACGCNDDGTVSPDYVRTLVADAFPADAAQERALWEQASVLGAEGVLALAR